MLSITAITDADYYLSPGSGGSGCGCAERAIASAVDYALCGTAAGEPPGVWAWRGSNPLGLTGEIQAEGPSADAFRTLINELRDPATGEQLGRGPQTFKPIEERVAAWRKKHPHATEEEVDAYRIKTASDVRHAVHAWDLTFSATKSWSVLHAALQWAGRHDEAKIVEECLLAGVHAALDQVHRELALVQHRPKGPKVNGKRTAWYTRAESLVLAIFQHHVSRERDPQLHWHVNLLNRVLDADGTWKALDATALLKSKHGVDATFQGVAEAELTRRLGYSLVTRPDGIREIEGVSPEACEFFSSRTRALTEEADRELRRYQQEHGLKAEQVPARLRWHILQRATLKTRRAKDRAPASRDVELEGWAEALARQTRASFVEVLRATDDLVALGPAVEVPTFDRGEVIARALADLQDRKSTWNRSHLEHALRAALPPMPGIPAVDYHRFLRGLADEAIASPEVVGAEAPAVVDMPASLRDPVTGRSRFDMPEYNRYTTRTHLAREDSLVVRLDHAGAPVIPVGTATAALDGSGLGPDQASTAAAIASSGRRLEVIDAPAGAGKTRMIKALSDLWAEQRGVGIVGFALSQNAADVMRGEGLPRTFNIRRWLDYRERAARGATGEAEALTFAVPVGAIAVVDETSMVDTRQLVELVKALEEARVAKIVLVGDTEQVDAVDAGGAFSMLVAELDDREKQARRELQEAATGGGDVAAWTGEGQRERVPVAVTPARTQDPPPPGAHRRAGQAGAYTGPRTQRLTTIRRFRSPGEAGASALLRVGDVTGLAWYEARGRITGAPDIERVRESAVAGFLIDYRQGRDTIVITGSQAEADVVASHVREALARAGEVERDGVAIRGHNRAGLGDLVQTRLNNRPLGVNNRQVWQVVGRGPDGELEVRPDTGRDADGRPTWGETLTLPAEYVQNQVSLAYAGTVEAVQGRTTDTAHVLVDRMMGRSRAYPAMTRGRDANYAHVVLDTPPPRHPGETDEAYRARARPETPVGRLAAVFATDDRTVAARTEIAAEQDRASNLGNLGPQWEFLVRETRGRAHRAALIDTLGGDADAVLADPASTRLFGLLRSAELRGHIPAELLATAMERGTLAGTASPASALYVRLTDQMAVGPLASPIPATFRSRVPAPSLGDRENEHLEVAREIGAAMDRRTAWLAAEAAADAPAWAVRALGPVPADPAGRAAWIGKVAHAAAYREAYGHEDPVDAIGRRPTHLEPERAWLWDIAARQIGMPDHERDLAACSDGELANRVAEWERTVARLPRHVDPDLRVAHRALREAERQVVEARTAGADPGPAEADREAMVARILALEEIAAVRADALTVAEPVRARAVDAERELAQRAETERARGGEPLPPEPDDEDVEPDEVDPVIAAEDREIAAHAAVLARARDRWVPDAPAFGSVAWDALDDTDPRKAAAVTAAALQEWNVGDPLSARKAELYERLETARAAAAELEESRPAPTPSWAADGPRERDLDPGEVAVAHTADAGADVEDDTTWMSVLGWATARLDPSAPRHGSPEWADLDAADPRKDAAEVAAALEAWNLGEPLVELPARVEAAEERAVALGIAEPWPEQEAGRDHRSHAELQAIRDAMLRPEPEEPDLTPDAASLPFGEPNLTPGAIVEAAPAPGPCLPDPVPEPEDGPEAGPTERERWQHLAEPPAPVETEPTEPKPTDVAASEARANSEAGSVGASQPDGDEESRFRAGLEWSLARARELDPEPPAPADERDVDPPPSESRPRVEPIIDVPERETDAAALAADLAYARRVAEELAARREREAEEAEAVDDTPPAPEPDPEPEWELVD